MIKTKRQLNEGEWRWHCMECNTDLGPMVGKHKSTCPKCGCKSGVCRKEGNVHG